MRKSKSDKQAIYETINRCKWDTFITLTFNSKRKPVDVAESISKLFKFVERSVFGRQKSKICRFPVIEETSESTHVHILAVKPEHYSNYNFKELLARKWKKIDYSGIYHLTKSIGDKSWYEQIGDTTQDRRTVSNYTIKYVDSNFNSIIWDHVITASD